MPNWLGDCVMALPSLVGLAVARPDATIDWLIKDSYAELGKLVPGATNVLTHGDPRLGEKLIDGRYDVALLYPNSFSSAWRLMGRGIPRRIGYRGDWRRLLLTDPLPLPAKHATHMVDYYHAIVRALEPEATLSAPTLTIPDEARRRADDLVAGAPEPLIGIGFGAAYGAAKMWPPDRFGALIDRLATMGTVVTLGAPSDAGAETRVAERTAAPFVSLVGETTLPELAAVMDRLAVYITNDTGPMHLAAALGTPTVAIFGPTDPNETKPRDGRLSILYRKADCAPCFKRECPIDHRCMTAITVDDVVAAVRGSVS